jgi:hypothetical protein
MESALGWLPWTLVGAAALAVGARGLLKAGFAKRMRRRRRTARAAATWNRVAESRARPVPSRVIVSMTSAPGRMLELERSVRTLLNQTCAPDEVHLNIPHVFRRTGEEYVIPTWVRAPDPRVRLYRVEDIGPATKSVPTVARFAPGDDVVVIVADDDVLYLQESIEVLLCAIRDDPRAAYGFSGYDFGDRWQSVLARGRRGVQVIEGWAAVAAHRSCFGVGLPEHVAAANRSRACFCHDDVVISNWFELQGVPRVQLHADAVNRRRMRRLGAQLDFGYLPGALHQESSGASRARDAALHLAGMGLWRLRSPPAGA